MTMVVGYDSLSVDYKYFKLLYGDNVVSRMPVLKVISKCSQHLCYMTCGNDKSCQGYNYFPNQGRCELMKYPGQSGKVLVSPGNIYMERLDRRK